MQVRNKPSQDHSTSDPSPGPTSQEHPPQDQHTEEQPTSALHADASGGSTDARHKAEINLWTGLRLLLPFARHGWTGFAAAAVLASLSSLALLGPFWFVFRAVDDIVVGQASLGAMYRYAGWAALCIGAQYLLAAAAGWTSHRGAFAVLEQVRLRIGRRLGQVPMGFLTNRRSGEVQRTLGDDIERLELFLAHMVPDFVSALATLVFMIGWLFAVDWRMACASLAVVVVALPLMAIGTSRGGDKLGEYTRSMSRMNASIVEFVHAMPVVRTFNGTRRVFGETKAAIDDAAAYEAQWGREFLPIFTVFYVLITSPILTIVPFGLLFWHLGTVDTSTLLFFLIVGLGFTIPLLQLLMLMTQLAYLGLGARLVQELDEAEVLPQTDAEVPLNDMSIEVSGVTFAYDGHDQGGSPALQDVTLTARPGTITALVGPSGAGKSTLARLIVRFWDVDAGAIRIGGVDIRTMPLPQLMSRIAFVFQETFLFDESVAANLRIAKPDADHDEIVAACKAARAHDFIMQLPQGYDTRIGENGTRLSGGERQRLAVARALLKNAPIVILDEATAYADPENEVALQAALDNLVAGRTVIVIAHRLSTIAGADQVLVLDEGRIVERGRCVDLVAQAGLFARMWRAFTSASQVALSGSQPQPAAVAAGGGVDGG